eukprot:TRINITY_DN211_c0_g1_i1.p1 TRINITY_DN211_c0_g1~~TRINITY_DN211_c0_g1_i1.p1  ORF type:complete len:256 (-),score=58.62 TRINITY_DN211_c0_g1_i1:536-1303(-)
MASHLDMTLDDIIKAQKQDSSKKPFGRGGRGGGRGGRGGFRGALGPVRRTFKQQSYRSAPSAKGADEFWQHDLFEGGSAARRTQAIVQTVEIQSGTPLRISNLDHNVSEDDIKELFNEVGDLKRCDLHYDRSGRSLGTADVVFVRKADALAAVRRYNNVLLDGKPMKVEALITNPVIVTTAGVPVPVTTVVGRGRDFQASFPRGRGAFGGRGFRGRGRGVFRGRGRGRGRSSDPEKTAEQLDAELDTYHASAMET